MGSPLQKLKLNQEELQQLQAWALRCRTNQALAIRARMIPLPPQDGVSLRVKTTRL